MMNKELLEVLACPECKGSLELNKSMLFCKECVRSFEIRDGVPVFV